METSASFEARSAPLPYPTTGILLGKLRAAKRNDAALDSFRGDDLQLISFLAFSTLETRSDMWLVRASSSLFLRASSMPLYLFPLFTLRWKLRGSMRLH